jgi:hypothetical protein
LLHARRSGGRLLVPVLRLADLPGREHPYPSRRRIVQLHRTHVTSKLARNAKPCIAKHTNRLARLLTFPRLFAL